METDIIIIGAGFAGLIASIKLSQKGYKVVCVDYKGTENKRDDQRTTALLLPSVEFLKECGVWNQIRTNACPLFSMRICDLSDTNNIKRVEFRASEIGEQEFGYNIQNQIFYNNLMKFVKASQNVKIINNDKFINVRTRTNATYIELESGRTIKSKLLLGADGKESSVREKLNIQTKIKTYNQRALAFKVKHTKPHSNISIEIYKSGGPFTIVPLTEPNQSAIIWMESSNNIHNILSLDKRNFNQAITTRSGSYLGELELISQLTNWPVINQFAKNFVKERCVLIAEAAHVLPPIGAQGLNISIQDIKVLAEIIDGNQDPGLMENLKKYEKIRSRDNKIRIKLIDGLNLSSISDKIYLQRARSIALQLIASSPKLKRILISAGLG